MNTFQAGTFAFSGRSYNQRPKLNSQTPLHSGVGFDQLSVKQTNDSQFGFWFISEVHSYLVAREEDFRFQILLLLSAEVTIKINAGLFRASH